MRRAAIAWLLLGLLAPVARAQPADTPSDASGPRTSSLGWIRLRGAEGCVGSRELAEGVEARLGRPVFVPPAEAEMAVEGRAEPVEAGGWRATLSVSDAGGEVLGERELLAQGEDCSALTEPLVLVVAILIDPEAALAEHPPARRSGTGREVEVREVVRTERVEVPVVVEREAPRWQVILHGAGGAAWGPVPGTALLIAGAVYVVPPGFVGIELEGGLLLQASATGAGDGEEARYGMGWVGLALCPLSSTGVALSVDGCLGANAGALRGPVSAGQDDEQITVDLLLRARAGWRVASWLSLLLRPTLTVPLRQPSFGYTTSTGEERTLFDPWPVGLRIELGAAFHVL